ncbi:hypothetical protein [Wukongibacter sp. M2B1]|uniref:hypothetical protein n=1 Tax=Wukongibacter sp. M2B1 TaxID=3088895 RepID=UPI003D7A373E
MKKILKWIGIAIVALIVIGAIAGGGDKKSQDEVSKEAANIESKETPENEKAKEKSSPEEKFTKYKAGDYKIGTDLPSGEYKLFGNGAMSYYEINKDSSGNFDSIIANDNFSTFSYISISDGQYVKLQGCYAVPIKEAPKYEPVDGKYIAGKYKVGFDIPAGEYKVLSDGTMPYVEVAKNNLGTIDSIISNDTFENSKYVTIKDGNYFKMQNCYIQQ